MTLPVIQPDSVPHGPLHLLIDSTGLQVYGAGQWLEAKHGAKSRRKWRKLHLAVDADNGMIVARTLTDQDADDPSQVAPLLNQIDVGIARVTADGAYDGAPTYATIMAHGDDIEVVIPPRSTAVFSGEQGPFAQRDRHLEMITERGRLACYSLRVSSCTKSGEHELSVECSGSPHRRDQFHDGVGWKIGFYYSEGVRSHRAAITVMVRAWQWFSVSRSGAD